MLTILCLFSLLLNLVAAQLDNPNWMKYINYFCEGWVFSILIKELLK